MRAALVAVLLIATQSWAADIVLTATGATKRLDGTDITGTVEYVIKYSIDNVEQPLLTVTPMLSGDLKYTLTDMPTGLYSFQAATVEDGLQGPWGATVSEQIGEKDRSPPEPITITISLDCPDGCNVEFK